MILDANVTKAKMEGMAAESLLMNDTASPATPLNKKISTVGIHTPVSGDFVLVETAVGALAHANVSAFLSSPAFNDLTDVDVASPADKAGVRWNSGAVEWQDSNNIAMTDVLRNWTANQVFFDNVKMLFGTGSDAAIYWDAVDLILDPTLVSAGVVRIGTADNDKLSFGAAKDVEAYFDGTNLIFSLPITLGDGVQIGTSVLNKFAVMGATPDNVYTASGDVTGFIQGSGASARLTSVWAGPLGSSAYTVGDLVGCMKRFGFLAP